ncbi:hypothetical protein BC941DRAFT_507434 [Chlamydoabsidia padenii]|nr:hypothetical protein BC941DRAFT_507434 [Chlamydoabsidia padenii]
MELCHELEDQEDPSGFEEDMDMNEPQAESPPSDGLLASRHAPVHVRKGMEIDSTKEMLAQTQVKATTVRNSRRGNSTTAIQPNTESFFLTTNVSARPTTIAKRPSLIPRSSKPTTSTYHA